jgi:hypothetical protein
MKGNRTAEQSQGCALFFARETRQGVLLLLLLLDLELSCCCCSLPLAAWLVLLLRSWQVCDCWTSVNFQLKYWLPG